MLWKVADGLSGSEVSTAIFSSTRTEWKEDKGYWSSSQGQYLNAVEFDKHKKDSWTKNLAHGIVK